MILFHHFRKKKKIDSINIARRLWNVAGFEDLHFNKSLVQHIILAVVGNIPSSDVKYEIELRIRVWMVQ